MIMPRVHSLASRTTALVRKELCSARFQLEEELHLREIFDKTSLFLRRRGRWIWLFVMVGSSLVLRQEYIVGSIADNNVRTPNYIDELSHPAKVVGVYQITGRAEIL